VPERIACCVPFCRRTIGKAKLGRDDEWICSKHWPAVPRALKRRHRKAKQIVQRAQDRFNAQYEEQDFSFKESQFQRVQAAWSLAAAIWSRCKAAAIEAAAGI
jgi:hypothetical protein